MNQLELRLRKLLTLALTGRLVIYNRAEEGWRLYAVYEVGENLVVQLVDPRWQRGEDLAAFELRIAALAAEKNSASYGPLAKHHGQWVDPWEIDPP